jgi:limonene 1,2-monooxygenase
MRRDDWRLVIPMHIAETREQALAETREGGARHLLEYVEATTGRPCPVPGPPEKIVEQMAERGSWVIGTPDDAIAAIRNLHGASGGFGCLLLWAHEWAAWPAVERSYDLIARYVMPQFQGSLSGILESNAVAQARSGETHALRTAATQKAREVT